MIIPIITITTILIYLAFANMTIAVMQKFDICTDRKARIFIGLLWVVTVPCMIAYQECRIAEKRKLTKASMDAAKVAKATVVKEKVT